MGGHYVWRAEPHLGAIVDEVPTTRVVDMVQLMGPLWMRASA
jgi:hypothetical protein